MDTLTVADLLGLTMRRARLAPHRLATGTTEMETPHAPDGIANPRERPRTGRRIKDDLNVLRLDPAVRSLLR
jgi:hypothetical protein